MDTDSITVETVEFPVNNTTIDHRDLGEWDLLFPLTIPKKHAVYVIAMSISHLLCLDPDSPVTVLAVSSDGTLCASADTAGSIQVFDVQNTKVRGWIYCRITCTPCERGAYYTVLY